MTTRAGVLSWLLDLADLASVRGAAKAFLARDEPLHALVRPAAGT